jgi:hypothetical protein
VLRDAEASSRCRSAFFTHIARHFDRNIVMRFVPERAAFTRTELLSRRTSFRNDATMRACIMIARRPAQKKNSSKGVARSCRRFIL